LISPKLLVLDELLERGTVLFEGAPDEVLADNNVRLASLGEI
jgi:ABC-type branched-subunit amino acid transport system ATPase component